MINPVSFEEVRGFVSMICKVAQPDVEAEYQGSSDYNMFEVKNERT